MRSLLSKRFLTFNRLLAGLLSLCFSAVVLAQQAPTQEARATERTKAITNAKAGKDIVYNRLKGNCLACHGFPSLPDAEQTGNSGPPIIAMQSRFPDRSELRAKVWDATASNAGTLMPPFGKHQVLTETEIDQVIEFIYGL